ncbi:50S ribosomal protein L16 [Candidatus Bathyarchaeota archaeon]|nr:MAG: 50S ribosomal protein L16 [Candidatus Bathyarchaeota archaeon]RLI33233.1 MAG: 50S ribosomal protein L16 [Candidatus Bathyarchaeota archaeon]
MKAKNFRKVDSMPYTRKEFIGGVPQPRITKFTMGNPEGDFDLRLELVALDEAHISHNALEAARIAANRLLEKNLGRKNYLLKILPYPHNVIRHHKRLNVAQADRFQEGMKKAYGKPYGTAARVRRGQPLVVVGVNQGGVSTAKEALRRARAKFPIPCRIIVYQ